MAIETETTDFIEVNGGMVRIDAIDRYYNDKLRDRHSSEPHEQKDCLVIALRSGDMIVSFDSSVDHFYDRLGNHIDRQNPTPPEEV